MNFTEKRLLENAVHIPTIMVPLNTRDHSLWPSFSYRNFDLNESIEDSFQPGYLLSSKDYLIDPDLINTSKERAMRRKVLANMKRSLKTGFFTEHKGFILTKRVSNTGHERYGLLLLLDYERYQNESELSIKRAKTFDYDIASHQLETMKNSLFDFPYASGLIEDESLSLIEPLISSLFHFKLIYSFTNPVFGLYEGYLINTPQHFTLINNAIQKLFKNASLMKKPTFIIHEGIESFESGSLNWKRLKEKQSKIPANHPARFQLVEIFNIFSDSLNLTPCNLALANTDLDEFVAEIRKETKIKVESFKSLDDLTSAISGRSIKYGSMCYGLVANEVYKLMTFLEPESNLPLINLESFISQYLTKRPFDFKYNISIDEISTNLKAENTCYVIMPPIKKKTFFEDVLTFGPLKDYVFCSNSPINERFLFESRKITLP